MARQSKRIKAKALVAELKELMLRDGAGLELGEKGLYHRALINVHVFGGSIDKNTEALARVKDVILELEKAV